MGKFVNYLQQPESIHAMTALLMNTKAFGGFTVTDAVEWFNAQWNITVNINELKKRWYDLTELDFAKQLPGGRQKIGYILTEKGEKMAQALMDCINYIGKLKGEL